MKVRSLIVRGYTDQSIVSSMHHGMAIKRVKIVLDFGFILPFFGLQIEEIVAFVSCIQ
jgi:hypothetical protein